jgi:hypothetical protein
MLFPNLVSLTKCAGGREWSRLIPAALLPHELLQPPPKSLSPFEAALGPSRPLTRPEGRAAAAPPGLVNTPLQRGPHFVVPDLFRTARISVSVWV